MRTTAPDDPTVTRLVEQQIASWELTRDRRDDVDPEKRSVVEDFVCISRDVGAGATRIGAKLAERLEWPVFDKEFLHAMAGDDKIREQIYASMDERDLAWHEEAVRSLMRPELVTNDDLRHSGKMVLALARQGSAIFIGRGADLILPRDVGLRVRIVAPLEARIKRIAERQELSDEEARKKIQSLQNERARYIRQHFQVDIHDPERYDLVIKLQRISSIQAVDLIESARDILAMDQFAP